MSGRRGRPPKFGRPARLVALTIPEDVLTALRDVHPDPAWAIVSLVEKSIPHAPPRVENNGASVDIALLDGNRGLIVVDRHVLTALEGVALVPLSEERAFLALEPGKGLADLELAVIDRLDNAPAGKERKLLQEFRDHLRAWRRDPGWNFEVRTIIVAERRARTRTVRRGTDRRDA